MSRRRRARRRARRAGPRANRPPRGDGRSSCTPSRRCCPSQPRWRPRQRGRGALGELAAPGL